MSCTHGSTSLSIAILYAFCIAALFVLNIYLLVPKAVSNLPRSNVQQIKWRILSVTVSFTIALSTYPSLFFECHKTEDSLALYSFEVFLEVVRLDKMMFIPLLHVMILYLGSFITSLLQLELARMSNHFDKPWLSFMAQRIKQSTFEPFQNTWEAVRNFAVAPLAEEIIFRLCIIPPFVYSGTIGTAGICWITPLFFGMAHMHHAVMKLKLGEPWKRVMFGTVFQMTYTSLFGAYASYCFVKHGSLTGIMLVHSFCNFMGLPNMSLFFGPSPKRGADSKLVKASRNFRFASGIAYAIGIAGFALAFRRSVGFFPEANFLPIH